MNYTFFIIIPAMILFGWIILRGIQTGEIYTKWGIYTGRWFISKKEDPVAFKGKLYLYSILFIFMIILIIIALYIELS